jgi:hypothetical protein
VIEEKAKQEEPLAINESQHKPVGEKNDQAKR